MTVTRARPCWARYATAAVPLPCSTSERFWSCTAKARLRLRPIPTDVGQLVRDVMRSMQIQAAQTEEANPYHFVCELPEPCVAMTDAKSIEQVLRNLLSNALKYSPQGGTLAIRGQVDGAQVLLQVSDEGIGIPEDELEKIFERFYRVRNAVTQSVRGAGLGLAVCRGIVEAHGGRIWAESVPGGGSLFCFTLPACELPAEAPAPLGEIADHGGRLS